MKLLIQLLASAFVLSGCATTEEIKLIDLNQPFISRLGQHHITPDKSFRFHVARIVEDSRGSCPKNLVCVWDGQMIVQLKYVLNSTSNETKYRDLRIRTQENFGPYALNIMNVRPSNPTSKHNHYRFEIEVKK